MMRFRVPYWPFVFFAIEALFLLAQGPPIATAQDSVSSGTLSAGTPYETVFYVQKSGKPGPTVVITGGIHGDEAAAAIAAEQIRHWRIESGMLVVLPHANPPAIAANSRNIPGAAPALASLNRNFPKDSETGDSRGEPAQAIWKWVCTLKPDWFVDLHEGVSIHGAGAKSIGSSIVVCHNETADAMATAMLAAVNKTVSEPLKKFVLLGPPVDGSLARALGIQVDSAGHINTAGHRANAMIVETSIGDLPVEEQQKNDADKLPTNLQSLSLRVRQHRIMIATLLKRLHMVNDALNPLALPEGLEASVSTRILIYDARGVSCGGPENVERIVSKPGVSIERVGAEELNNDSLKQADLLVIPGGYSNAQAAALGENGRQKVRRFVESGGGYIGICAGAYLGSSGFDWSLHLVAAQTISPKWNRGIGIVKLDMTAEGNKILGDRPKPFDILYYNGPILEPMAVEGLEPYAVLANFHSEITENGAPRGIMVNSPAIVASHFGKGRVVLISPHPEQLDATNDIVLHAMEWATQRDSNAEGEGRKSASR